MGEIWTEKYRPKFLKDVIGQEEVVSKLKNFVDKGNIPHLLFSGPAGVGKTTCALAIARELYGENWRRNFLELNASDERGIDTVRTKIKDFARTKPLNAKFKIILLDEADSLTADAQQALRRTMENYASSTRFILDCNYSSRIIDPIQSRCAIFRFKPLEKEEVVKHLEYIAKNENVKVTKNILEAIYDVSQGDLRKAINLLQTVASMDKVDVDAIYDMTSIAKPEDVRKVMALALKSKIIEARDMLIDTMLSYGLSGIDILKQMQKEVWNLNLDSKIKLKMIEAIGDIEFRIVEGSDEIIQLETLLAKFGVVGKDL